jgi:clan AA aspartic protease (TIGR02281 family)
MRILKLFCIIWFLSLGILADDFDDFKAKIQLEQYDEAFEIYTLHINGQETEAYQDFVFNQVIGIIQGGKKNQAKKLLEYFLGIEFNHPMGRFLLSQIEELNGNYAKSLEILYELQNAYIKSELLEKVEISLEKILAVYLNSLDSFEQLENSLYIIKSFNDEYAKSKWKNHLIGFLSHEIQSNNFTGLFENYPWIKESFYDEKFQTKIKYLYQKTISNYIKTIEDTNNFLALKQLKSFVQSYGDENQIQSVLLSERKLKRKKELENIIGKKIPLQKLGNSYFVQVSINNKSAKLLLDTGASITMLNKNLLSSNEFEVINPNTIIYTASGSDSAQKVIVNSFGIGDIRLNNFELIISNKKVFQNFDGLLGMDFLGNFQFSIDQENGYLIIN